MRIGSQIIYNRRNSRSLRFAVHLRAGYITDLSAGRDSFRSECFVSSVGELSFVSVGIFGRICLWSAILFGLNVWSDSLASCHSFRAECFVIFVCDLSLVSVWGFCHFCQWVVACFDRNILSVLSVICHSFRSWDCVWDWRGFVSDWGEIKQLVAKKCLP